MVVCDRCRGDFSGAVHSYTVGIGSPTAGIEPFESFIDLCETCACDMLRSLRGVIESYRKPFDRAAKGHGG